MKGGSVLLAMLLAVPLTSVGIPLLGWQRAVWVRAEVLSNGGDRPDIKFFGDGPPGTAVPVLWHDDDTERLIGLRPVAQTGATLVRVRTDHGEVDATTLTTTSGAWTRRSGIAYQVVGAGVLGVPGRHGWIELAFENGPGAGVIHIGFREEQMAADLEAPSAGVRPIRVEARDGLQVGWALLPGRPISVLHMESDAATSLRRVTLMGPREQHWVAADFGVSDTRTAGGCLREMKGGAVDLHPGPGGSCRLDLSTAEPVNVVAWTAWFALWAIATVVVLGALWLLDRMRPWLAAPGPLSASGGARPLGAPGHGRVWSVPRAAWLMGGVGVVGTAYHFAYSLWIPMTHTYDSIEYYRFGHNLANTLGFVGFHPFRTPGYPAAIAASILAFGDQLRPIALLQHSALAAGGVICAWLLHKPFGWPMAGITATLVAVSPIMSISASTVLSESLFAVTSFVAVAILLAPAAAPRARALAAGVAFGFAVMLRPSGVVLLAVTLAWVGLRAWATAPAADRWSTALGRVLLIVAGYGVVAGPWLLFVHQQTGQWTLTSMRDVRPPPYLSRWATIGEYGAAANLHFQGAAIPSLPINRPYRAVLEYLGSFDQRTRSLGGIPVDLLRDPRLPGEMIYQSMRLSPRAYGERALDAFAFNLLHLRAPVAHSVAPFIELRGFLNDTRIRQDSVSTPADAARLAEISRERRVMTTGDVSWVLTHASKAWLPPDATAKNVLLWPGQFALDTWHVFAVLAVGGILACVWVPAYRDFLLLGLCWCANVAPPSVLLAAAERYALTSEAMVYVLASLFIHIVVGALLQQWRARIA